MPGRSSQDHSTGQARHDKIRDEASCLVLHACASARQSWSSGTTWGWCCCRCRCSWHIVHSCHGGVATSCNANSPASNACKGCPFLAGPLDGAYIRETRHRKCCAATCMGRLPNRRQVPAYWRRRRSRLGCYSSPVLRSWAAVDNTEHHILAAGRLPIRDSGAWLAHQGHTLSDHFASADVQVL